MNHDEFHKLVTGSAHPVILIEGTRALPDEDYDKLVLVAKRIAERYPHAVFRTGNATGSDEAFAEGVKQVDPSRIQYVLPYARHRSAYVAEGSSQTALSDLPLAAEQRAVYHTIKSSPEYKSLIEKRDLVPQLKSKSSYILRDTVKVIGTEELGLAPATVGLFYVNTDDPMKGGTGHTVRVCQEHKVPVAFQDEWMKWPRAE